MARYRNVCFTHNNPREALVFDEEKMVYLVYQEEHGESGTYHFQGYCEFKEQTRLAAAKELLGGPQVHIEPRRGTQSEAIQYCKKEDTRIPGLEPYEEGTPRTQGKRIDLEDFKRRISEGEKLRDLVDDHLGLISHYPRLYGTLRQLYKPVRTDDNPLSVVLLYGETGLGKTRYVMDRYANDPELWCAPINNGTMWFDAYDGHTKVLLDDFSGKMSHCPLQALLRILDRYSELVPTKGGHTWWMPSEVFVTTNILPRDWYSWENRGEQYKALARRFTKVRVYSEPLQLVPGGNTDSGVLEFEGESKESWFRETAPQEAHYAPRCFIVQ